MPNVTSCFVSLHPDFRFVVMNGRMREMMADHFFDVLSRASRFHVGDRGDA